MTIREQLDSLASQRILILDGAMGTMIQELHLEEEDFRGYRFASHTQPLKGCNDLLCLSKRDAIFSIHQAYLRSGSDLIETCSFNATSISLSDYGLADFAYEINVEAAKIAREAADLYSTPEKPRFVVGIIGPTNKTASLSPDVNDPGARGVSWDELLEAYTESVRGLLDGGADLLMVETIFDTLNAKAALFAISGVLEERNLLESVPIMISLAIVDAAGRTLSGQTVEAFCASTLHAKPWSLGLNCSLGAEKLGPHVQTLSSIAPCLTSAHPNAGMPNRFGEYDESPETMASLIESFLKDGLVNVVGGCCGSTPSHIAAIAAVASKYKPRAAQEAIRRAPPRTILSGLEPLVLGGPAGFIDIGERTNVAGSKRFLRLIKEGHFEQALSIAREMVEAGASIIDVCMDDALLDAGATMTRFLNLALADPDIARVPVMVDSSRWDAIEAGLKCLQGKGLVNSISLKEGPEEFLRRARLAQRYGAAVVVMLFDERGQADTYERKIEVAERSYNLLKKAGFPPEDIVFDPNVLAIATGIPEHDSYALDFIRACQWISEKYPLVHISGGISNLSFSFRGNDLVREAMHAVFLKHAMAAGLSMAIVNPASLISYDDVEAELREIAEDVVLARRTDAAERMLNKALELKDQADAVGLSSQTRASATLNKAAWRELEIEERIIHCLIKGIDDQIEDDVLAIRSRFARSIELIEGPLMRGMNEVGDRFGSGRMFLPQVIRSARVMKKAVAVLEPYIQAEATAKTDAKKLVLATVKGDVHDIGKNIVGVVLGCNGYDVVDLGVMVPAEDILDTAIREKADMIGLSGLITPSLDEMVQVAKEMERRGFTMPLLIGGATTSEVHTALRIANKYSGPVIYVKDASRAAAVVRSLLSDADRPRFLEKVDADYRAAAERHEKNEASVQRIPLSEARSNPIPIDWLKTELAEPRQRGIVEFLDYDLERLIPYIDWSYFFYSWDLGHGFERILNDPEKGEAARKLYEDALHLLDRIVREKQLKAQAVVGFFPAASDVDDLVLYDAQSDWKLDATKPRQELTRFKFPRNQDKKKAGGPNPCLSDLVAPIMAQRSDWVGVFALTAGHGLDELVAEFQKVGDDYNALLSKVLADRLAEAFAEELHERVRKDLWGYASEENLSFSELFESKYRGIRPAFGYPACPDHTDKQLAFDLLGAEQKCGMKLTESDMMLPAASVCGLYFANPSSYYFGVGVLAEDQVVDWAERKGIDTESARKRSGRA